VYGVDVAFTPIEDSGGPLTLKALVDNQVQMVNIFSADPNIAANDLVTLEDPEGLFLASHVVPLVSDKVTDEIAEIINTVSAALTAEDLVALNALSVNEQQSADQIASDWLGEKALF
jgi:osmoprotectant transport system substrate-binding protein